MPRNYLVPLTLSALALFSEVVASAGQCNPMSLSELRSLDKKTLVSVYCNTLQIRKLKLEMVKTSADLASIDVREGKEWGLGQKLTLPKWIWNYAEQSKIKFLMS